VDLLASGNIVRMTGSLGERGLRKAARPVIWNEPEGKERRGRFLEVSRRGPVGENRKKRKRKGPED